MEMKRTGPTNPLLEKLIGELKKRSNEQSINLWKRVASDLEKPTRQRRVVNLSKINRYTKEDETIVVPGKVLGSGALNHKLTISAYQFSDQAKDKLEKAGAEIVSLLDISKEKPNGKKIKIIG
jgi:large subunit ribosomal protein L18e|tara:strand:- start:4979 stop:5347 length:369 start_codon:yes stop_codon:yes gene_type:complete